MDWAVPGVKSSVCSFHVFGMMHHDGIHRLEIDRYVQFRTDGLRY